MIVSGTEELHERIHELEMALAAEFRKTSSGELHPLLRAERSPEAEGAVWIRPGLLIAGCFVGSGLSLSPEAVLPSLAPIDLSTVRSRLPPWPAGQDALRTVRELGHPLLTADKEQELLTLCADGTPVHAGERGPLALLFAHLALGTQCNTLLVEPSAARSFADAARTIADASTAGVQAGVVLAEFAANEGRLGDAWGIAGEALVRAHGVSSARQKG